MTTSHELVWNSHHTVAENPDLSGHRQILRVKFMKCIFKIFPNDPNYQKRSKTSFLRFFIILDIFCFWKKAKIAIWKSEYREFWAFWSQNMRFSKFKTSFPQVSACLGDGDTPDGHFKRYLGFLDLRHFAPYRVL